MSFPHPFKSSGSASQNTFPAAYRAWAHWVSVVGYGGLQVAQIRAGAPDVETARPMLCEVYARAVMETVMAQVFDQTDSRADVAVYMLVHELYGMDVADDTVNAVGRAPYGVLVRSLVCTHVEAFDAPAEPEEPVTRVD
jgi:hypothetical protein